MVICWDREEYLASDSKIIIHSHCHYHPDYHSQPEQSGNFGLKNSSRSYSMLAILMKFSISLALIGSCPFVRVFYWITDLARHRAKSAIDWSVVSCQTIQIFYYYSIGIHQIRFSKFDWVLFYRGKHESFCVGVMILKTCTHPMTWKLEIFAQTKISTRNIEQVIFALQQLCFVATDVVNIHISPQNGPVKSPVSVCWKLKTYICNKYSFQRSIIVTLRQSCGDGAASVRTWAQSPASLWSTPLATASSLIQLPPPNKQAASQSPNKMTASSENLRA